jgi:hypothetical protein
LAWLAPFSCSHPNVIELVMCSKVLHDLFENKKDSFEKQVE